MNEHADQSELPELNNNEDVELIYHICKRASESSDPPFKALFAAYDEIFAEQQIEQEHDGVVFRYLMRIGESTRAANRARQDVDLVQQCRSILEALGIQVVDNQDGEEEDVTRSIDAPASPRKKYQRPKRRVSFDDAKLDETWLSQNSQPLIPPQKASPRSLLSLPPRRGRGWNSDNLDRRARSTSSQRNLVVRSAAPKDFQHPSTDSGSEAEDPLNPYLYFEPSQTQLDQNAEAFLSTSALRAARQVLGVWHERALQIQQMRAQSYSNAVAQDRRLLLRQSLEQWRAALDIRRHEKEEERRVERLERRAKSSRAKFLLHKSFTHWATQCRDERVKTKVAQHHVLMVTYFRRWKAIAIQNQTKMRRILTRKFVNIWREKTARRQLWQEQAVAHYKETLMRKCKRQWFWHFCSRRVEGWHEEWVLKRALIRLRAALDIRQVQERQAIEFHQSHLAGRTMAYLRYRLGQWQEDSATARRHCDRLVECKALRGLQAQVKLAPIARTVSAKVNLDLQRKAIKVWHLNFGLSQQAAEVDRKRVLQTAWTSWNDALRCKALAQKIDERVLVENLYRWLLQERLLLFQRTVGSRLLGRAFGWWLSRVRQERDKLGEAQVVFAERQRRRRLTFGMFRLNVALRHREDAERAAVELANSHALPKALDVWKEKTDHARELVKWAADARFYSLCSSTLRIWKEKMVEHKQNRRRSAYVQVRARLKIRLVRQCFVKWRTKTMEIHSMEAEAERRAQARLTNVSTQALDYWQDKSAHYSELNAQATNLDHQKLLGSALSALVLRQRDLATMDQQAVDFRNKWDLALVASALRCVQWATFTVARKIESAEALWKRNETQHHKQMLRHWASRVAAKRQSATMDAREEDEPESPSIRPASRAASRTAELPFPSSPPSQEVVTSTPGYMRTPRSRRAGRFRPLPTPAAFTPMTFDSAYLTTTPAPLPDTTRPESDPFGAEMDSLTPQVTPFSRKLRAGGFTPAQPSALKSTGLGKSVQGGTNKSVRFAGASRFRGGYDGHEKNS